jgi:hypothetical protein
MGYTTTFSGHFNVTPAMSPEHAAYINKFGDTRRMKRDSQKALVLPDPIREAAELPVGLEGGYFVGGVGFAGQENDISVLNHNDPPEGQPGLWCQWQVSEDRTRIEWDGGEKFYNYTEWLNYLIDHFLSKWGYTLEGNIYWQGEDPGDIGQLTVENNEVDATELHWGSQPDNFPFVKDPYGDEDWDDDEYGEETEGEIA